MPWRGKDRITIFVPGACARAVPAVLPQGPPGESKHIENHQFGLLQSLADMAAEQALIERCVG